VRILVIREPTTDCIDGIHLRLFRPGIRYEVGQTLGALFVAEGWAEPVAADEPAGVIPPVGFEPDARTQSNLVRETFPPYYDAPVSVADRRRRPRHRRSRTPD
jgi:hypothetical protein